MAACRHNKEDKMGNMRTYRVIGDNFDGPEYEHAERMGDIIESWQETVEVERVTYSCSGIVRGDCGHHHYTIDASIECSRLDGRQCGSLGGGAYSDRNTIVRHRPDSDSVVLEGDPDSHLASNWEWFS